MELQIYWAGNMCKSTYQFI